MIELANTTSQQISIGDWFLSDSSSNLTEYEIPAVATIAANGYYVLTQDNNFGFTLDPDGSTVYLSNNYNGQAGGYQESQSVDAMPPGLSYGLYTKLDGGTNYSVSSITLSGTTATATLDSASTILQNGEQIYIGGAAQSQYDGDFIIANVAANSSAGTTTFTYTVTGSPASPATAISGESIFAAMGSTNFTLLQTPSFGTLSGTTYSGAANSIPYVSPLVTDEIMYDPAQPTATEAADGYVDHDFEYLELYNRSSSPVPLSNYYVAGGIGYTPGWIPDGSLASNGTNSEFETLASGATATWSASNVPSGSYTVYAHLNLYDGDNNPVSPDSQAQYTVTCGGVPTTMTVDQAQVPTTLSVSSLTYNNSSGLVTAAANNSILNNNSLAAGSIVHISGATPSQYDGTFVVQSATSTSFTYSLASGLGLAAATGTITAGLNDVWISLGTYTCQRGGERGAYPHHQRRAQRVDHRRWDGTGEQPADRRTGHADLRQHQLGAHAAGDPGPRPVRGHREQLRGLRGALQPHRHRQHPGTGRLFGPPQQQRRHGRHLPDRQSCRGRRNGPERLRALLPGRPHQLQ